MTGRETALARARVLRGHLLAAGVPEVSIEVQEGRPTSGDRWNACRPVAVMSHHIASNPTVAIPTPGLRLVKTGRSDLPGPLCNGTAGVDLVYRIICMGYANHSGSGGPWTVAGPLGAYTIPRDVGRPYIWGTEYEGGYSDTVWDKSYTNRRTGKSMTFREFMGRANAGLVRGIWDINGHGKTPRPGMDLSTYHGEHGNPWAPGRKPDRRGYTADLSRGRREITHYSTPILEEDDMPLSDQDVQKVANAVWTRFIPMGPGRENPPAQAVLRQTFNAATAARVDVDALAAAIVAALPAGSVDETTVVTGVKRALAELVNQED